MTPVAFERWLQLWGETTDVLLAPAAAAALQEKAARIAESLGLGIAFHRERGLLGTAADAA
jgi:hemoglobin